MQRLKELEKKIGYTFQKKELLQKAMMHSSYTNEKHMKKQRLQRTVGISRRCGIRTYNE